MASPPALLAGLDLETSLLIAQLSLADIRQQLRRVADVDERCALQLLADDFDAYLKAYEDFRERASISEQDSAEVVEMVTLSNPPHPLQPLASSSMLEVSPVQHVDEVMFDDYPEEDIEHDAASTTSLDNNEEETGLDYE
ncbi:hypothetical protein VNI00_015442 [Paramarasmius palmivorus]|uniref:Uncharacterized protein n=1 Tax=Paramarasmius palmivorus TaxID=297713 RepID=A0AAW0BJP9_9AGAR